MKCPQCDGYGKVTYIVRSGNRIISKEVGECDYCYGTGEVNDWETESTEEPMTNEEYLRSLNTEQLAEWLSKTFDLCGAGCSKCFVKELCFNEHINKMPSDLIVMWLKQPHGGES